MINKMRICIAGVVTVAVAATSIAFQNSSEITRCLRETTIQQNNEICCSGQNGYFRDIQAQTIDADTIYTNDLFVSGTINVDITVTVTAVSLVGDLTVTGSLIVQDGGIVLGDWNVTDQLVVTGTTTLYGDGCVLGDWCVGGDLSVGGTATFNDSVSIAGDLCVSQSFCSATITAQNLVVTESANIVIPTTIAVTVNPLTLIFEPTNDCIVTQSIIVDNGALFRDDVFIQDNLLVTGSVCVETQLKAVSIIASSCDSDTVAFQVCQDLDRHALIAVARDSWDTLGNDYRITNTAAAGILGQSVALSAVGDSIAIGSNNRVLLYTRVYATGNSTGWNSRQVIIGANEFGASIAMSADGRRLVVGAPATSGNNGAVFIYDFNDTTGTWVLSQQLTGLVAGERFGSALSMSADGYTIAVGAPLNGFANSGSVYLFGYHGTSCGSSSGSFVLQQQVSAAVPESGMGFGSAAALSADGRYLIIGAPNYSNGLANQGAIYFFGLSQNSWSEKQGPILSPTPAVNAQLGFSVTVANGGWYAAAGSPGNNTILCYGKRYAPVWDLQALITPASPGLSGYAVSLCDDGSVLLIGERSANGTTGRCTVVLRFDRIWNAAYTLIPGGVVAGDAFGSAVQLSRDGSFCAVGAPLSNSSAGSCYAYRPVNTIIPTDLTISGSTCVLSDMTIAGDLFVTGSIVYSGTLTNAALVPCTVQPSDMRIKQNIEPLSAAHAEALLARLRPVHFAWHNPELHSESGPSPVGFIAQEVEEIMPHWVQTQRASGAEAPYITHGDNEKLLAISTDMYAYIVAALQKSIERTKALEEKLR